jgi:hypothetical protein
MRRGISGRTPKRASGRSPFAGFGTGPYRAAYRPKDVSYSQGSSPRNRDNEGTNTKFSPEDWGNTVQRYRVVADGEVEPLRVSQRGSQRRESRLNRDGSASTEDKFDIEIDSEDKEITNRAEVEERRRRRRLERNQKETRITRPSSTYGTGRTPIYPQQPGAGQGGQPQLGHPQQPQARNYPYGHPYYSNPYYAAYVNQYQAYGKYPGRLYGAKGGVHQQYSSYYSSPYYAAYVNQYQNYGNYPGGPYGAKGGVHQQYPSYGIAPGAPEPERIVIRTGPSSASSISKGSPERQARKQPTIKDRGSDSVSGFDWEDIFSNSPQNKVNELATLSRKFGKMGWKTRKGNPMAQISSTISKDNTLGEDVRNAKLLADFAKKRQRFAFGGKQVAGKSEDLTSPSDDEYYYRRDVREVVPRRDEHRQHPPQSGLSNGNSAPITLPSISDQLGDINHLPEPSVAVDSAFPNSPPSRPPPGFSAVPGHKSLPKSPNDAFRRELPSPGRGHFFFNNANTHRRPSQTDGPQYASARDYSSSNTEDLYTQFLGEGTRLNYSERPRRDRNRSPSPPLNVDATVS